MIKINKSANPPRVLMKKGTQEKTSNNVLYDSDPQAFQSGKKKIHLKNTIYRHKTVKEQLIAEQSDKCCFCEAEITTNSFGDVEHFRPKGGYQQTESDNLKKPGYYWKAYDWDNLFFSCQICNTRHKKNYFPLAEEQHRAKSHHDDIGNEKPLLIHPAQDDPEQHIGFREHVCFPIDQMGEESIPTYGLNRKELVDIRRKYLNSVQVQKFFASFVDNQPVEDQKEYSSRLNLTIEDLADLIEKARQFMKQAATAGEPFAGMVRNNFPDLTIPFL